MSDEDLEYEKALSDMEESCGVILNEIHNLIMKPAVNKIDPIIAIATCLTLVIKNIEKNLCEQDFDVSFDEILHEIKTIDFEFTDLNKKDKDENI